MCFSNLRALSRAAGFLRLPPHPVIRWNVSRFGTVASTNDLAMERMRAGAASPGDVFVAERQSAGRGRLGRAWDSPPGALILTAVLPFYPHRVGWTALAAGIAVARAVRDLGAPAGVKWPNDVVLEGRKLAGILAETAGRDLVAVGIGLNVVNPPPEDPQLAARVVRLADVLPSPTVEAALERVLARLAEYWAALSGRELGVLRREWEALDTTRGRRVHWTHGDVLGVAVGVDETGALRIRAEDGDVVVASVGEVLFVER